MLLIEGSLSALVSTRILYAPRRASGHFSLLTARASCDRTQSDVARVGHVERPVSHFGTTQKKFGCVTQ